ncbi:efflux transporter outer membrane subunit [Pandoraea sp.]|uniref:efflux transporter outer membrane subunit n=1 Tax=Pandoraea sp. TaxID=1883445 RepID=UPI0025CECC68|nr:efflux transporter outer membrane subunit [Pandoraea sp.]
MPGARVPFGAALIVLLATCAGCASLVPPYERPPLPVPNRYPADATPASHAATAPIDWRDYFVDTDLQAVIAQALSHNRDLRVAAQRVEAARAAYGVRAADQLPTISGGATYARFHAPGGLLSSQPLTASLYDLTLTQSSWELDFWGRVRSLKEAALEQFLASTAARRAVRLSLIAQVADGFLVLRELDERIALTRQTISSRQASLHIFRRRYQVGAISKLELTQAEILLQQAQALMAQLEQSRALAAHTLDLLVGAPTVLRPAPYSLDDDSILPPRAGLPSELLENRPDIVAAEHQLRAAHADIGAARAAFFPRIALTSSFGAGSTALGDLFSGGSAIWSFVPSLSLPIFDAGRNRSNLALARARENEAVAQYEKAIQAAFRDVADALAKAHWLSERITIERDTLASQTERARLAKLRYDSGAAPFLEVLDAQRDMLAAQQQLIQTRRALLESRVALFIALGGDTSGAVNAAKPRANDSSMQRGVLP